MTTLEKISRTSTLLRPTDLSIKSCLNSKYREDYRKSSVSPPDTTFNARQGSSVTDHQIGSWKSNNRKLESRSIPSPMALVFGNGNLTTMTPTTVMDSAAKLVVLDTLFSQCNGNVRSGHSPTPVFEPTRSASRSRGSSDSSNEKFPVNSSLLEAVKGLADLQRGQQASSGYAVSNGRTSVTTPTTPTAGRGRGCKRKGGWKFHDLSDDSDGLGRRKRAYCHNRLENEILQLYQDRVCIKEVPGSSSAKLSERLVVIEPSYVTDPDLIKHNTGLRIVFDKKRGTYQLQVLPFTIEQGSLSNKSQVICAVAKMLGENGAVLCPGITRAFLKPNLYMQSKTSPNVNRLQASDVKNNRQSQFTNARKNWLGFAPNTSDSSSDGESSAERYRGRWKILNSFPCDPKRTSPPGKEPSNGTTAVTPTDRLLLTLNKELSKTQRQTATVNSDAKTTANRCLLWHVPTPGGKGKRSMWPQEAKWCANCVRNINAASDYNNVAPSMT